jgi:arylsulfatase A-like enzyme
MFAGSVPREQRPPRLEMSPRLEHTAARRPNILLIVTDDQRVDAMKGMNNTRRWFRRGGTRFANAFTPTPNCCPARSSIMTGRYPHNTGVLTNHSGQGALDQSTTIQRRLHNAGYRTAIFGKYFNFWNLANRPPSFDRWAIHSWRYNGAEFNVQGRRRIVSQYVTDYIAGKAARFLRRWGRRGPWFLYVAPFAPHHPFTPESAYANAQFPRRARNPSLRERNKRDKPRWVSHAHLSPREAAAIRRSQLRTLQSVDDLVARLLRILGDIGERRDTLAVYTSDNGYLWAEHGLEDKGHVYKPSIQVPLFARWPGHFKRGSVDRRLVSLVDIAPTIVQAARLGRRRAMDGRSLLSSSARTNLLVEYFRDPDRNHIPSWSSLLTKSSQYVEYRAGGRVTFREYYDLERDPWQLQNVFRDGRRNNNPDARALHRALRRARGCRGRSCP